MESLTKLLRNEQLVFILVHNLLLLFLAIYFSFNPLQMLVIFFIEGILISICYSSIVLFFKNFSISGIKQRLGHKPNWKSYKGTFLAVLYFNIFNLAILTLFFIVTFGISLGVIGAVIDLDLSTWLMFSQGFLFTILILLLGIIANIVWIIIRFRKKIVQFNFDYLMSRPAFFFVYFVLVFLWIASLFLYSIIIGIVNLVTSLFGVFISPEISLQIIFLILVILAKIWFEYGGLDEKKFKIKRKKQ